MFLSIIINRPSLLVEFHSKLPWSYSLRVLISPNSMMIHHNNDLSSSDDQEMKEALVEATDHAFLKNSLFNNKKTKINITKLEAPRMDIKYLSSSNRCDNVENFGVSGSFKKFVAKKLYEFLESNNRYTQMKNTTNALVVESPEDIRLLSSSTIPLSCDDDVVNSLAPEKLKITKKNYIENISRYREVAVDSKSIIAKTETVAWSQKQKGVVFKYKKILDGTLIKQQ